MIKRIAYLLPWFGIALIFFSLPITSFPLVAKLTGSTMVAPLSILPLGALLIFWLLPHIVRGGILPPQNKVLVAFLIAVLISCIAAVLLNPPPYKGHTMLNQEFEALMTLAVGVGFYFLISAWLSDSRRISFVLRWVNWGGLIMLLWAFIQAGMWYKYNGYPDWMWDLQGQFSTNQYLFQQRANGFAYEPSWFAHQLNMLFLPYWLSATLTGFSAHTQKLWKIRFENILLLGGLVALFLSVSRVGWLAFLLMVAYAMLHFTWRFIQWAQRSLSRYFFRFGRAETIIRRSFVIVSVVLAIVIYVGLLLGTAYGLSKYDPRMANLFDFASARENSVFYYANQLVFAERIVFWQAGWGIFNDYPILGVGLGNVGFYFPEKLSAFSWGLTETRLLAYQWTALPNTKNLWVRLLAETGIIGFSLFVSFWYVLWRSAQFLISQKDRMLRMVGLMGALVLVGFIIEGFSIDTFALAYFWVSFALITAVSDIASYKLTSILTNHS